MLRNFFLGFLGAFLFFRHGLRPSPMDVVLHHVYYVEATKLWQTEPIVRQSRRDERHTTSTAFVTPSLCRLSPWHTLCFVFIACFRA